MNARYADIIARLKAGETVTFRGKGNSMVPIIYSGQEETLEPIADPSTIRKGDAVFCKVRGNVFTHKVTGIRKNGEKLEFQISNNHGHVNGWTSQDHLYGRLIAIDGKPYKTKR